MSDERRFSLRTALLAGGMLLTGTINTVAVKFQDLAAVDVAPDGSPVAFKHPAFQTSCMFFGEMLCLIPWFIHDWRRRNQKNGPPRKYQVHDEPRSWHAKRLLVFAIPAACDVCATTLLNVGLFYTYASTYQMLRGTLVLFAGFFTVVVLKRSLYIHHWLGMVLITAGAAVVGAASLLASWSKQTVPATDSHSVEQLAAATAMGVGGSGGLGALGADLAAALEPLRRITGSLLGTENGSIDGAAAPLFGDIMVVCAQAFTALQFILEEKFVAKYKVPSLLAVGLEGSWGVLFSIVLLPLLSSLHGADGRPLDSFMEAIQQISAHKPLLAAVCTSILSISFFNFFGIRVTKALSGAARATIDACRTLFIWLAAMALGWELFLPLQVVGFVVLISGTSLYNEMLKVWLPQPTRVDDDDDDGSTCSSAGDEGPALDEEQAGAPSGGLTEPLLPTAQSLAAHEAPRAILGSSPAHPHHTGHVHRTHSRRRQQEASPGEDDYTMARSMRLGIRTLSPRSLDDTLDGGSSPAGNSIDGAGSFVGSAAAIRTMGSATIQEDEDEGSGSESSGTGAEVKPAAGKRLAVPVPQRKR